MGIAIVVLASALAFALRFPALRPELRDGGASGQLLLSSLMTALACRLEDGALSMRDWESLRDALTGPLRTDKAVEEALLEIGRHALAGRLPPRSVVDAVSSVRQYARGIFLSDLASALMRSCATAAESTKTEPVPRKAPGRKRPRVDGLTHGVRVPRWEGRATSSSRIPTAAVEELDLVPQQAQQATPESLELDLHPPAQSGRKRGCCRHARKAAWQPGHNAHGFLGRGRGGGGRVSLQTHVLLVNGYKQLQNRSRAERACLRQMFPPLREVKAVTTSSQILSGLLRVPPRTVENTVGRVLRQGTQPFWRGFICGRGRTGGGKGLRAGSTLEALDKEGTLCPTVAAGPPLAEAAGGLAQAAMAAGHPAAVAAGGSIAPDMATGLASTGWRQGMSTSRAAAETQSGGLAAGFVNVVRVTQFMSSHGLPKALLPNILHLIVAAKGDVGGSPQSRRFCSVAEAAADALLLQETALLLQRPLPGTGRPPDIEVFADGGTVGQYYSSGRDTVLVVGAGVSTPWWPYTASLLVACVNEVADARASATEKHLTEAFERLGAGSFHHWRSERFAVAVGDQALAPGGPAHFSQNLGLKLLWDGHRSRRDVADLFHLINRAGKGALEQPAATALFSLLKSLEHCFGLGHGRHLDRSVAAFLGETPLACKSPAGHRKTGYLCGVPERFLQKYRNFFYGILVRMNHSLDKRGSKSFSWLKELGEQLSDQTVITFALGLVSGLAHNVAAISARSQNAGDLPWTRWRALRQCQQSMEQEVALVGWWRGRLTCLALLEAFLPRSCSGLRNWWRALCFSPRGRRVCNTRSGIHMGCQLYTLLFSGVFQGCALQAAVLARGAGARVAHPACQCCTTPRPVPGSDTVARGGCRVDAPSVVTSGGRDLRVPRWVSRSLYSRKRLLESAACEDPFVCLPRWQCYDAAGGLAHRACSVPIRAEVGLARMNAGLTQLQHFWLTFAADFEQCCLGDLGVSTDMQHIFAAMSVCWWLEDIVQLPRPTARHEEALVTLWGHLKADMQKKSWPPEEYQQGPAVRRWPNQKGIVMFYRIWWQQVHRAAHSSTMVFRRRWRPVVAYEVTPVRASPLLQQLGRVICAPRAARGPQSRTHRGGRRRRAREAAATRSARLRIIALLRAFLSDADERAFLVPADTLRFLDGGAGGVGRAAADSTDGGKGGVGRVTAGSRDVSLVGRIAVLQGPRLRGRVVRVVAEKREWDQLEITASLEQDSFFATGCYYVNALFCLSRRFGSTEAPCERWIGGLKYLYHPVQGPTTTTLVQRLRARAAGVRGNGADEDFIERLAHELSHAQVPSASARPSALQTFQATARRSLEAQAPWMLRLGRQQCTDAASQGKPYKELERSAKEARSVHEPRCLEEADRRLLCAERDRGMARMPLFAATRRQWDEDRSLPQWDLGRSRRALAARGPTQPQVVAAAASQAQPVVAAAAATQGPVAAAAASRMATQLQVAAAAATHAATEPSTTSTSTSSSSSDSSPSSSSSARSSALAADTAAADGDCPWVAPKGPLAKLHWRIDLEGGQQAKLCRPATEVAAGRLSGNTVAAAEATGRTWCQACLRLRSPWGA